MSKHKKSKKSIVTLVEDPYGIKTDEIYENQGDAEELILDQDILEKSELSSESSNHQLDNSSSESLDDQLDKLSSESLDDQLDKLSSESLDDQLDKLSSESLDDQLDKLSSESLDDQFDKLAQALAKTEAATLDPVPESNHSTQADLELEAQIQEDQALAQEIRHQEQLNEGSDESESESVQPLDAAEIQSCIEALLFISDKPLSLDKLQEFLGPNFTATLFEEGVTAIIERYQASHHGIELIQVGGGYQFRTKPGRAHLAKRLVKIQTQRLSSGAMETLALVAYKQPVMKEEIDKVRGVDSSYFIRNLLDRKMIKISGRSELPGRPMLYTTTPEFLELFGLMDLSSLPSLRELEQMIPGSQTSNPEDEDPRVKEMRRLVGEMKGDRSAALHYNPKEDEKILKEIREKVSAIPISTPYLDEMKAAETAAKRLEEEPPTQEQEEVADPTTIANPSN